MSNINLIARLNAQAVRAQEFMSGGKEAGFSQKRMDLRSLIEVSISNHIKDSSFKKLNTKNKLSELVAFVNDKDNVEYSHLVYKSTVGKDFDSFIRTSEAKWLKGLTFVVRIKDDKNKYFHKNTVLFEVNLSKEKDGGVGFVLNNIILMNFPKNEHALVRGMKKSIDGFQFKINPTEMPESDLLWMNGLRKPIDLWADDSKLNINLWRAITSRLKDYNESRKNLSIPVFGFDGAIEVKKTSGIKLIAFVPKDFQTTKQTRYFLNNINDSSLKGSFWINKKSKDISSTMVAKLADSIAFYEQENNKISLLLKEKNESKGILLRKRQGIDEVYIPLKESKIEIDNEITEHISLMNAHNNQFHSLIKELKNKKQNLLKLVEATKKKIKKDKKKKGFDSTGANAKISNYNQDIANIDFEVTKKEAQLKSARDEHETLISSKKTHLKTLDNKVRKFESEISDNSKLIKGITSELKKLLLQGTENKEEQKKLAQSQEVIAEMNKTSEIVLLEGNASIDDRNKKTINIPSFNENGLFKDANKYLRNCEWQVSDYDHGFATVIRRNNTAMRNLSWGNYKSPYLAMDLNTPTTKITIADDTTVGDLNEKQKEAFRMINNSYQASFLQGPPGTGKTQVISNIVSYYANGGEISLISSSTNEAINNAMERINRDQKNNPNIIFLRVTNSIMQKQKAAEFLEDQISINFIKKMISFSGQKNDGEALAREIINKFSEADINAYIPKVYFDNFKNEKTIASDMEFFSKFLNEPLDEPEFFVEDSQSKFNKLERRTLSAISKGELLSKMIEEFYQSKINDVNDYKISTYEFISHYNKGTKTSLFDNLVQKIKTSVYTSNKINNKLNDEIINVVSSDNLINIIGITTTSRQEILINGQKREIFTDYPVDFAVIDEVSKSITPEVIQISSLSSKFLYAGDYRQLPPAMDIPSSYISEFWKWEQKQGRDNQFDRILRDKNVTNEEEFNNLLVELYDGTLFKNQVKQLKNGSYGTNSYVALDVQHRFTDEIQELVNVVYDKTEQLKKFKGHAKNHFNDYAIYGPDTKSSIILFDTSYISNEFSTFAQNNNAHYLPNVQDVAFDQNRSIFGKGKTYSSMINEYNAFEGISIIMNLKKKNPKLKPEDIGYICMTRSQVNSITWLLMSKTLKGVDWDFEWLKRVKIDTVDNFQGREKDIIIVDLVRAQNHIGNNSYALNERTKRNLEFYSRNERLNVAVSRAKSKLILLGAIEGHLQDGVISDIERNGEDRKVKIFAKYKQIIEKHGKVIQSWTK